MTNRLTNETPALQQSFGTDTSEDDGVEQDSIVAVSTLGCKRSKLQFMRGYNEMRIYDKDHYLVKEIAYHPEPALNNRNRRD